MRSMIKKHIVVIFCFLLLFSYNCKDNNLFKLEDPSEVNPNDIISLSRENEDIIRADGISTTILIAKIPEDSGKRTITFKTNLGTFIGSVDANTIDVTADVKGESRAELKVGKTVKTGEVIALISGYRARIGIELKRAHADRITGETSTLYVTKNGSVKALLKAFLSRDKGDVSIGTTVEFSATQLNDQNVPVPVGRFLGKEGKKTDEKGIATITFAADTKNVLVGKQIKIKMTTNKDDRSKLVFELSLNVRLE